MDQIEKIDKEVKDIDEQILKLLDQRMEITGEKAKLAKDNGLFMPFSERERELIAWVTKMADQDDKYCAQSVFHALVAAERAQYNNTEAQSDIYGFIMDAVKQTALYFPQEAVVACQGTEGAYSQISCDKMFKTPSIMFFDSFASVFKAVEAGMCQYGVLPIENSTAGSVNAVYDLMLQHNFSIVRSARLKINHNLFSNTGATMDGIREVISHQQAISQCSVFLSQMQNVEVRPVANTAMAAKYVAESGRTDIAAISSAMCGEDYNLTPLKENIQDNNGNYTRFICISKDFEVYPGADRISLIMTIPHRPGALYNVLAKFYALGVNIRKLESRPMPESESEFEFYLDIEAPVYSPETEMLFKDLEAGRKSPVPRSVQ